MSKPIVMIMGSASDLDTFEEARKLLGSFKVGYSIKVLSAHRTPKELERYIKKAAGEGARVFIAAAGGAAALAGVIASHTTLPVIGIPIETKSLKGLDSLLSTVQMPAGIPVACMAIGKAGATNAALFALGILALHEKRLRNALVEHRKKMRQKIKQIKIKA